MRQATSANAPTTMAAPTPPTTPPTILFDVELRPLEPPLLLPVSCGVEVCVANPVVETSTASVVATDVTARPSVVRTTVEVSWCVLDATSADVSVTGADIADDAALPL